MGRGTAVVRHVRRQEGHGRARRAAVVPVEVEADRAAVRAVTRAELRLVGIAVHGPKTGVDRILKGARLHG
ncbi:DUF2000 domain-containing protein [Dactylosporangium fulvum]|uniref:DUF2000 domain-containing protein n=1 Tax=Dactylosporangium fulvum TaxID=53359 RepID=A0ABY5W436_9ACTN|nr:DUF2000 domain-containing protein [Dactylosporangium fulvum]